MQYDILHTFGQAEIFVNDVAIPPFQFNGDAEDPAAALAAALAFLATKLTFGDTITYSQGM